MKIASAKQASKLIDERAFWVKIIDAAKDAADGVGHRHLTIGIQGYRSSLDSTESSRLLPKIEAIVAEIDSEIDAL